MLRRRRQATAGLSLFPFLDVLCCTMGSLIMLLCVLAKAAKGDLPRPKQPTPDYTAARQALQQQLAHVRRQREEVESTLAESRQQLSHVEDHARALRDEIIQLEEALAALARPDAAATPRLAARRAELEAQVAKLRDEFAKVRDAAREQERNYAIVPYEGENGTFRRPVYIECRADSVVLQPEGIVLNESDFTGALGPGNPLAAALRATHEYLTFDAAEAATIGEPYPLLLVRPEGIGAYYAARAALKSWGSEFGYELVEADWELSYPESDARLAAVQREAVETARERRAFLARSAPKAYGRGGGQPFHDFSTGGDDGPASAGGLARRGGPGGSSETPGTELGPTAQAGLSEHPLRGGSSAGGESGFGAAGEKPGRGESGAEQSRPDRRMAGTPGGASGQRAGGSASPGGTGTSSGDQSSGAGAPSASGQQAAAHKSVAESRGRDWALPNAGPRQIPVSRPIRIVASGTRLTIPDESPSRAPRVIELGPQTEDSIDDLVSAIWDHQKSWGIAGNGMYWRPILKVEATADGTARAADLAVLLADSGLVVEAVAPQAVVRQPATMEQPPRR